MTMKNPPGFLTISSPLLLLSLAFAASGNTAKAPAGDAANASALSVCVDTSSPGAAMDRKVAAAVAHQQGVSLRVHEFDGSGDDDDGFALKEFNRMAASECQLVLGFPVDAGNGDVPDGLRATAAYARTGFVLVTPTQQHADSLSALAQGSEVAVTMQTAPNLYFAAHPQIKANVRPNDQAAIAALEKHQVQAAVLWRPAVADYLQKQGQAQQFGYSELDEPHARWNLVALYDPANADAAARFEQSIRTLQQRGQLAALLQPYAVVADGQRTANAMTMALLRRGTQLAQAAKPPSAKSDAVAAASASPAAANAGHPALYTAEQAEKGKADYADNCALCHGDALEGRAGPALKGKNFANPNANFHVGDIFAIVSLNMPATQPASLPPDQYVEIMAFLLQQNGYPAGSAALTFDAAKASTVPLIYSEPAAAAK